MQPDEELEVKEARLQELLEKARKAEFFDSLQAELSYKEALEFTKSSFGATSRQAATALFYLAAFYSRHDRTLEARFYFEQVMAIMNW